jgi:RNA polymerase sigma-70 factor (ECF subfamily)
LTVVAECLDERLLLKRARDQGVEAEEVIYKRYILGNTALQSFLRREVRDPSLREDLFHEIYLRVVHSQSEFRGESSLKTYIFQIARRVILEQRRRDSASKRGGGLRFILSDDSVVGELPDHRGYANMELSWVFEKILLEIPEAYRETLRLRLIEERDYLEISKRLGLNINTVSTRIHKGKRMLIALLKKHGIWGRFRF